MLVSSPPNHPAEKFSPTTIASGLRSLLVPPNSGGGVVVTRALAAASSSRGCGGGKGGAHQESRDGDNAKAEGEEDVVEADEEEEDGFWVSYGRREPRRRLPPPIPSLLARGALRRTRTADGRLVIRIAPVVWRECIRTRRRGGCLAMQLVDHDDALTLPAPNMSLPEPDDDTASPTTREGVAGTSVPVAAIGSEGIVDDVGEEETVPAQETPLPVVPPPRVPSAGCFEDVVFKYGSIGGGSSLDRMPSLRMVH